MKRQRGFTLIEVMIALVVLLTGMLGVMSMQYYSVRGNATSREMRIATGMSQRFVELLKATPFADLSSGSDTDPLPVADVSISGGVDYTTTWWVLNNCVSMTLNGDDDSCNPALAPACAESPDATPVVNASAVRVRTCWNEKDGSVRSVTLDSLRWDG